ncbi:GntR family transcriptional regulator [Azonexus caeni]|uniref:GntR family transcriptional regulator n=1 Tax=Azonexus caeni TaxID=266126 RepID=UPI003A8B1391
MAVEPLRYEKLAGELAGMIGDGILKHGDRLPSVRRLSQERRLSVSTVVQAMRQLEERGLVEARPQSGYFVRPPAMARREPEVRATPDGPMPVDISQRLVHVLQAGAKPGVAPLSAALPVSSCCRSPPCIAFTLASRGAIRTCSKPAATSIWTCRRWSASWCAARWPGVGRWRPRNSSSPTPAPRRSTSACAR